MAGELAVALADLLLFLPRQAGFFLTLARRRREFARLAADPPPAPASSELPARPLRRLLLSCGDASGESHALRLLAALRRRHPGLQVEGFGGRRLEAEGMQVWEPLADLNVMGFKDVAAQLPLFLRCVRRFAAALAGGPPDAVVLVDYPGLNRHLLRIAARAGVPVADYVAPQLWAWSPWRVRDFRRADALLTILPFEGDWYRRRGARPVYVGHPLGDRLAEACEEEPPPEMDARAPWVGLLPGSRRREIRECLPVMLEAAAQLHARHPELRFVLPHLRLEVLPLIEDILRGSRVEVLLAPGRYHSVLERLRTAWVTSGTALLEAAAHAVPPVLVYGISSRLAAWLGRHALAVPGVGSLNLMAGAEIAPEHVGRGLDPGQLARSLEKRLDGAVRVEVLAAIARLCPHFAPPGAAERAARAVEAAAGLGGTHEEAKRAEDGA